jgi:hypothetical protein
MSELSNGTKKHTLKSRETIPLRSRNYTVELIFECENFGLRMGLQHRAENISTFILKLESEIDLF